MKKTVFCIDSHACGNPVRVVAGGGPLLPHLPIAERRAIFQRDHDWIRTALMFEPRGHDIMSGAIFYAPFRDDCDVAVVFIEVSGCLPMCGAGTIGLSTVLLEEGLVTPRVPGILSLETPAGRVDVSYEIEGGRITSVRLFNVPSFLHSKDVTVEVEGLGPLTVDIAYGGNFYAVIEPQKNWAGLDMPASEIVLLSQRLRRAVSAAIDPVHPQDDRIRGVHHAIWCDNAPKGMADGRSAVFYGDKAIDRSPGGTGTSARLAQLYGRGRLNIGDNFRNESLIGTVFDGKLEEAAQIGPYAGIRPSLGAWARVTGYNTIFIDEHDPLYRGFQIT
ncbi:4-hydroxyproline epimerase [Paracoccus sp. (in: a-proteobacteria)]|uniref:4-hydroxyproline epimerase n=1 Tax=Paracoccus sp. TaxID=267 RepID=UPI003342C45A